MLNSMIVASVSQYTQGTLDKNGKEPVILNVTAGTFPNRTVLSGTVAERNGIEVGKTYMFSIREVEANEFGRQFVYQKLKELTAMEIAQLFKELGAPKMIDVNVKTEVSAQSDFGK